MYLIQEYTHFKQYISVLKQLYPNSTCTIYVYRYTPCNTLSELIHKVSSIFIITDIFLQLAVIFLYLLFNYPFVNLSSLQSIQRTFCSSCWFCPSLFLLALHISLYHLSLFSELFCSTAS